MENIYGEPQEFFLFCESANISDAQRKKWAKEGKALPDGSYPIPNVEFLKKAIKAFGRNASQRVKSWIIKRAKALGATNLLPDNWKVSSESDLSGVLCLEFDPTKAIQSEDDGTMRIRVPFYIGNSVATPSNWGEPLYFSADELPKIVAETTQTIQRGSGPPLTVYPRHRNAQTADRLPAGVVESVEAEGQNGFATLRLANVGDGAVAQGLIKSGMLNAVSLRSHPGFDLEEVKVNGQKMYSPKNLKLAGIDFAPDGAAMDTYGVQILNEAPTIEPVQSENDENEETHMEITLEAVRTNAPAVLAEIERPLRERISAVEAEKATVEGDLNKKLADAAAALKASQDRVVALEAVETQRKVDGAIKGIAAKFPKPDEAEKALRDLCAEARSEADVYVKATPVLLEALSQGAAPTPPTPPAKTPAQVLAELGFGSAPKGSTEPPAPPKPAVNKGALPLPE